MSVTPAANHRELLEFIEGVLLGNIPVQASDLAQRLQPWTRVFPRLLQYPGPNPDARQQVLGGNPATPRGHIRLDEHDIRQILVLSDELHLDELQALQCLITAHEERGEAAADVAAGIYLEERRGLLGSLHCLLQTQALAGSREDAGLETGLYEAICNFNMDLLKEESNGRRVLVSRLIALIKDTSLEPAAASRLAKVVDERGSEVDRRTLLQQERTLLCECLVYCSQILYESKLRHTAADIADIFDLMHGLVLRTRSRPHPPGKDGSVLVAVQHAYSVLLALVCALHCTDPSEPPSPALDRDDDAVRGLVGSVELVSRLEGSTPPEDDFQAVARLAWGVLLMQDNKRDRFDQNQQQAAERGAFRWIASLLESTPFVDDLPHQKELYADILCRLLMQFMQLPTGGLCIDKLAHESVAQAAAQQAGQPVPEGRDSLATFLAALGAVYATYPDLWLGDELRFHVMGQFMEWVTFCPALKEAGQLLVAFLDMLTALNGGPQAAQIMFTQLEASGSALTSWSRMFGVIKTYCDLYRQYAEPAVGGGQGRVEQRHMPVQDAKAIIAFLHLFARVFSEGDAKAVGGWRAMLEKHTHAGAPLWELLFLLMSLPVPQDVKAATHGAIASLARSPELAVHLLERLLQAGVVTPLPTPGVPRYDITYQLNEIEARAEDYQETLAFVRLVNALFKTAGQLLPDDGRPFVHLTEFVRTHVLGGLHQRAFKSQKQKWELAAACFQHLQLALMGMQGPVPALPASSDAPHATTPALLVMMDLLGERAALRAAMGLVIAGVETAAAERREENWGGAREDALLGALRLIRLALARDQPVVAALRRSVQTGQYEPLEVVIKADKRRLPALLDYVRYTDNPAVQAEAIRITSVLAKRMANLVDLLLQAPERGQVPPATKISSGFGACLWDSLFAQGIFIPLEEDEEEGLDEKGDRDDPRASLILNLLLQAADYPAPNLTHMLLGFTVGEGAQGIAASVLDPLFPPTCLGPLLKGAESSFLPATKAELYEQVVGIMNVLASSPLSMEPVLQLLRTRHLTVNQLETVACAPLPPQDPESASLRAAALHQTASLLQLAALDLLRSDPAISTHRESCVAFLSAFFVPPDDPAGGEMDEGQRVARAGDILDILAYPLTEPQMGEGVSVEVRRFQQRMGIDTLLASPASVEEGGVHTLSPHGDNCYDIAALAKVLRQRYVGQEQDSRRYPGGPTANANQDMREACRRAISFAQKYNAAVQEAGGQQDAIRAWQAVVEIAFAHRFDLLTKAVSDVPGGAVAVLQSTLQEVLEALLHILPEESLRLAPPLCQVVRTLMMRLEQQASLRLGLPSDPTPAIRLPSRCHELLFSLLQVLREGRASERVRLPMYGALLHYLQLCRPQALARVPAHVLEALLRGLGVKVDEASSQLSALEAELESGNAAVLSGYPQLIDLVANDAVGPSSNKVAKALALSLFGALLASGGGPSFAEAVNRTGIPTSIVQELVDTSRDQLLQVAQKARASLAVQEGQLALLLRLVWAGLRINAGAASNRLSAVSTINMLAQCRAVDLEPEDPGPRATGAHTLRGRLAKFNPAVLRVVTAILAALPESSIVRRAAADFVGQHYTALLRMLSDAAHPGTKGWDPGDVEFEQATLVLILLTKTLADSERWGSAAVEFQKGAFRLLQRHADLRVENDTVMMPRLLGPSMSSALRADDEGGTRSSLQVWSLRCALASYLHHMTVDERESLTLAAKEGPYTGSSWTPSLETVQNLIWLARDRLFVLLNMESRLLADLRNGSSNLMAESGVGELTERTMMAKQAAGLEREEVTLRRLIETCLAVLISQLQKRAGLKTKAQDVSGLKHSLLPILDDLDGLDAGNLRKDIDLSSLKTLLRNAKEAITA